MEDVVFVRDSQQIIFDRIKINRILYKTAHEMD